MSLQDAKDFLRWLYIRVVAVLVGAAVLHILLPIGRDDSDGPWPNRSGIAPSTDALTGCQYLVAPGGGITPRLDGAGMHLGCRRMK